ncbi:GAF and ANTAR domain-containing protein [Streptomyces sp. SID9913]|jgi:GAF domain-containing protein|uniref:GAF and ANTAR domain-containing protein n=1 Tax=Streptomyces sp. SID9913 TaxID=2706117 RepID=UPI0013D99923|nr:GAF and ANTAR domain-containing protein [Streptomyces sp. SID9913]MBM7088216.1 GAF and ANTAR domain-containing protein [Streptomyces sp. S12]NED16672.1 GAF and ANTAR domain-containing protein [Streptomyces sp. SID9913]
MPKRFVVTASRFSELPRFPDGFDLAEALTGAARRLHGTSTPHSTLDTAVRLAVELLPGAEYAGICAVERENGRRPLAWSDEIVRLAEEPADTRPGTATGTGTGAAEPYWDRLWNAPEAGIADSTLDEAGAALAGLGLRSALSQRLRADRRRLTVLTVYARKPHAFDDSTRRLGRLLTAHVGIALESATVREQLTEAMRTRDLIGQATGILMERMGMDASAAFDRLVRASQRENTKLRDLARRIVDAHGTPDGGGR